MQTPTNLVLFLSDNHSRRFLGAAGHPVVRTPALDSIAERGVRFDNAYSASPLCCPARAAIATGRYPHQTGYWDNALAYDGRFPTWHHRLREAGYETASIGKLHFRSSEDDNGFAQEIDTMHILEGKGALATLLRSTPEGVPQRQSHLAIYEDSVVGEAEYQIYDQRITEAAIHWLQAHANANKPWALVVSFPSPHPPFKVPQRFWDIYPLDAVEMPVLWRPGERPKHPADDYLAWMNSTEDGFEETFVRRVNAGYCGLISHMDEQLGRVLDAMDKLSLTDKTRVMYTSDHGEAAGHHGILGKANHYEHSIGVPLLMAGPDIPSGQVVDQLVSHVDLFPTIVESAGREVQADDDDLLGRSLWPALDGQAHERGLFAEYHANGSRNSSFVMRDGDFKLIYHAGMPKQLFDLSSDPFEQSDLLVTNADHPQASALELKLRTVVDPEATDARSKAEQRAQMERYGGAETVRKQGMFSRSPIPGAEVVLEQVVES
jgi:choline-sulfatase